MLVASPAYNDGFLAFKRGEPSSCSRNHSPTYRQDWYSGWYDGYLASKFEWWWDE